MRYRPFRLTTALVAVTALLLLAACGDDDDGSKDAGGATTTAADGEDRLGPADPASGEPVKIGLLSDGQNSLANNEEEVRAAKATVKYLNEHRGGLSGRPIELVVCEAQLDPAKTIDCANQLVQAGVAAAIMGGFANQEPAWKIVHEAGIPMIWAAANLPSITGDAETSFVLFNARAALVDLPIAVAEENDSKKLFVVVVDVPAAKGNYEKGGEGAKAFDEAGLDFEVKPVPLDAADLTPVLQDLSNDSETVVHLIGSDAICIAAFNAMRSVNFTGPISSNAQCISDNTRKAVPGSQLKGVSLIANAPIGVEDESTALYRAVMDKYGPDVDRGSLTTATALMQLSALDVVGDTIEGDITPESVLKAFKSMDWMELPASGGLHFRCNGKAVPESPALCVRGALRGELDGTGHPGKFDPIGDKKF